jgi:hypothetical protein
VKYELGYYIPEGDIPLSHRHLTLKSYNGWNVMDAVSFVAVLKTISVDNSMKLVAGR